MTLVVFATVRYKRTIADNGIAVNFLQNFRFLFFRHKPAYFYWNCLARSVLLCMIPVVFAAPAVQVIVVTLVLVFFQVLQVYLQPWRAPLANMIDAVSSTSMVLLMVCIALTGDFNDSASAVGFVATVIMILTLAWAVVAVTITIYKRLVPSPLFALRNTSQQPPNNYVFYRSERSGAIYQITPERPDL